MVLPFLRPIEYGADDLASIWFPFDGIWVNPRVQAGASCIRDTRVPTSVVRSLLARGGDADDIADDLDLEMTQVRAAQAFEASLSAN
jgi:uncharacterized protein (DUF433 family)